MQTCAALAIGGQDSDIARISRDTGVHTKTIRAVHAGDRWCHVGVCFGIEVGPHPLITSPGSLKDTRCAKTLCR